MEALANDGGIVWVIGMGVLFVGILYWGFAPRFRRRKDTSADPDENP